MQYFSDGYRPGDPRVRPAADGRDGEQGPLPDEVDVLVVGSGPAGLLLAAQLAAFPEIVTRVVEKAEGPLQVGRADGVNCRTVEMFEAFGLAGRMIDEAYWVNETHFWGADPADNSRIIRLGRTQDVRDLLSEFPHVIVNQARLLDFLLESMACSPSRLAVDYGHEAVGLQIPDAAGEPVTVTLRRGGGIGDGITVRARYVVGCDGAHSVIRQAMGRTMVRQGHDKAWGVMDLLAVTDFPDIRFKCTIQAGNGNSILLIPREGGHLFRLYVDMGEIAPDARLTADEVLAQARGVLAPYTLDVKETAWFSVYRVGHGVTDKFDDVPDDTAAPPRVFIAGDACHTHTAKAGQGMNVSMADTFNLGWKLVAVLHGRSPADLLHTYHHERHGIAEDLIAMDTRWSKAIGAAQVDPANPRAALIGLAEVQRQFVSNLDFTAGMATRYAPGLLTGDDSHVHLAAGYEPGRRFHSAEVIRLCDAKRVHLGHVHRADARWRIYAFADAVDPRNPASRLNTFMDHLAGPDSPVARYTPRSRDADAVFDVRAVLQQFHHELDWVQMHAFLKPRTGPLGLVDHEKVFCPLPDTDHDIFDLRRIDRGSGALVVVRPDQYVALTLPLDGYTALDHFFGGFMNPA
ncbi:MAG: FAD-dependent monooxygenase [Pseudonocardia sp.]